MTQIPTEITILPKTEDEEYKLPAYSDKGRILVSVSAPLDDPISYSFEYEVLDYDDDSSVFWINEGTGFDWWLEHTFITCDDFKGEGVYVIEGIHGEYIRGEWGFSDDDEEWDYDNIRFATQAEIENECLQKI